MAGLSAGDTIFFIADKEDKANYYAGHIRTELGEKLDLIEKNAYRFCYVNDFPMFELDPRRSRSDSPTIRSLCPRAVWKH